MKKFKSEKGLTAIDIATSVVILAIFLSMIASLIALTRSNYKKVQFKSDAVSYAIREIEEIRAEGYIKTQDSTNYDNKGVDKIDTIESNTPIKSGSSGKFTGYSKTVTIEDYSHITGKTGTEKDNTKNKVKKLTVTISYRSGKNDESIELSTYVAKE